MTVPTLPQSIPVNHYSPERTVEIDGSNITLDRWLKDPLRVNRALRAMTQDRFVSDYVFTPGGRATGGAVIYDQVLGNADTYTSRDVQAIEPGSEFPLVGVGDTAALTARTTKYGGAFFLTYEDQERDRRDLLNKHLTALRNTITRKVDTVSTAVLRAAPILTAAAGAPWSDSDASIFTDVATIKATVARQDMGYDINTAIISPTTELNMVTNEKLLSQLPTNMGAGSPILSGRLAGLAGITRWIVSTRVGDDEVIFTSGNVAGSISDEKPLYSRVVDQPEKERTFVMAARIVVPYVTDPKSVIRLVGVA